MKTKHLIRPAAVGALAYESGIQDKNDCTVRALANAASIPYTQAHAYLKASGRKNNHGAHLDEYAGAYMKAGFELVSFFGTTIAAIGYKSRMQRKGIQVNHSKGISFGRLLETLNNGRYIVIVRNHALAVVNGKVFDTHATSNQRSVVALFKLKD